MLPDAVNQHYLDKVMDLADELPVVATEDILDARGNKLLAKGARVSRALQEKLIAHRLARPLESALCVEGGVDARLLVATAERVLRTHPALASLLAVAQGKGPSAIAMLGPLQFGNAMTMMLTIVERAGSAALDHAVMVSLVGIALAKHSGMSPELQQCCALAGLLHDIGELYIDPALFQPGRRLAAHEWAHLVVHPRTGQLLIEELEDYPKEVARAVAEHHERLDGSGYPRRLAGGAISPCGQVLAAAEAISGMLRADHPLERAELALKLMTREHGRAFLLLISAAKRHLRADVAEPYANAGPVAPSHYGNVVQAIELAGQLAGAGGLSPAVREAAAAAVDRLRTIQRAAISSGLDLDLLPDGSDGFDGLLVFEHAVASCEVRWRLRELARDLMLQPCTQGERAALAPLVAVLDPAPPAEDARAA